MVLIIVLTMRLLSFVIFSCYTLLAFGQEDSVKTAIPTQGFQIEKESIFPKKEDDNSLSEDTININTSIAETATPKQPINLALHLDYGKVLTLPFSFESKVEAGAVLEVLERIELVGELGYWDKDSKQAIENGTYNSTGTYYRVGAGFLVPFNKPGSSIGLGFRYGISNFEDRGTLEIGQNDVLTDPFTDAFERQELSARWVSGVLTSMAEVKLRKSVPESRLNRLLKIGLQLRLRFLVEYDRTNDPSDPIEVYTIPGYGRTLSDTSMAANFFVRIYPFGH